MISEDFAVSVSQGVPHSVRELFWQIFFVSKGRGISLATHFPWLEDEMDVFCLMIPDMRSGAYGKPLAALLIRRVGCIGLVGLVCVAHEWRGKGLSKKLLSKATDFGQVIDLSALVLWTQKPDVYVREGFKIDEQDFFCHVKKTDSACPTENYSINSWPDKEAIARKQGLAPFAISGEIIESNKAKLVVFHSSKISTLVHWEGKGMDVVDLIHSALPSQWALSLCMDDELIVLLKKRGFYIEPHSSSVRMTKILRAAMDSNIPQINVMDRI